MSITIGIGNFISLDFANICDSIAVRGRISVVVEAAVTVVTTAQCQDNATAESCEVDIRGAAGAQQPRDTSARARG